MGREDNLEKREWQLTPVFLPGESYGQGSLEGYSSWGHKELDMTGQIGQCPVRKMWAELDMCFSLMLHTLHA